MFDTSGNLVTGVTFTAREISKDGGAFAATTNAPAEIGTSGVYTQTLTATEMTADRFAVRYVVSAQPDVYVFGETVTRQFLDLAFPNVSGRGMDVSVGGEVDANVVLWLASAVNALVAGDVPANVRAFLAGSLTAATFALDAIDGTALAPTATAEIADRALGRSIVGGADGGRTVSGALKRLRNRTRLTAGTLEVYEANDTTLDWTAVATQAAGNPIIEVDPV